MPTPEATYLPPATVVTTVGLPVLQVTGLSARYDGPDIFTDVGLTGKAGAGVRVTGQNGAGKSTLLRCLAGTHRPRTGRIQVNGIDLAADPVTAKRHIGYAAGDLPFTYLTGREHLQLGTRVYGLPGSAVSALIDRFHDWAVARSIDDESRRYSHGMRQQLKLLLAVLHQPSLLIMDEATEGLDDQALADWISFLAERVESGTCVIYVEHRDEVAARFPTSDLLRLQAPTPGLAGE